MRLCRTLMAIVLVLVLAPATAHAGLLGTLGKTVVQTLPNAGIVTTPAGLTTCDPGVDTAFLERGHCTTAAGPVSLVCRWYRQAGGGSFQRQEECAVQLGQTPLVACSDHESWPTFGQSTTGGGCRVGTLLSCEEVTAPTTRRSDCRLAQGAGRPPLIVPVP